MDFIPEKESDIIIRKYRSILSVSGKGVLLFALWSIIRFFIYLLLFDDYFNFATMEFFTRVITISILALVMIIDLLFRIIVWRSAEKVSKGKKKTYKYLIIVVIFILIEAIGILFTFFDGTFGNDPLNYIVTLFLSATSTVCTVEVLICSLKIRKAEKSQEASYAA